jgi:hypothetical protein
MNPRREEHDTLSASRHPFQTYLLALAVVSGIPLLFGRVNSGTIQESMSPLLVLAWGVMLVFGSLLALVGTYWRGHVLTGYVLERAGLTGVGGAAFVYAITALLDVGVRATFSSCITAGFGIACFAQARRISRRLSGLNARRSADE